MYGIANIYSEANRCADKLVKLEHSLLLGISLFNTLLGSIKLEFLTNCIGHNKGQMYIYEGGGLCPH